MARPVELFNLSDGGNCTAWRWTWNVRLDDGRVISYATNKKGDGVFDCDDDYERIYNDDRFSLAGKTLDEASAYIRNFWNIPVFAEADLAELRAARSEPAIDLYSILAASSNIHDPFDKCCPNCQHPLNRKLADLFDDRSEGYRDKASINCPKCDATIVARAAWSVSYLTLEGGD